MNYLFVIPPSKRMLKTFVHMIRDECLGEGVECDFLCAKSVPKSERSFVADEGIIELKGKGLSRVGNLRAILRRYDRVIWYGLLVPDRYIALLALEPGLAKKSSWVVWGIDLYTWKIEGGGVKNLIKNWLHKRARNKLRCVICIDEKDRQQYKASFPRAHAACIVARLPISREAFSDMERMGSAKRRFSGELCVQVEHNGHSFNHHLEILESLKSVDCSRNHYYLPLAYGGTKKEWSGNSEGYIDSVISTAEELFPGRVTVLHSMMPTGLYNRFLWNMDIAIFGSDRQNGLGNILRLLYVGNKVFLPKNNPYYRLAKDLGFSVSATEDIKGMSDEEFARMPSRDEVLAARKWVLGQYHPLNLAPLWKKVFRVMNGEETESEYNDYVSRFSPPLSEVSSDELGPFEKSGIVNVRPYNLKKKDGEDRIRLYIVGKTSCYSRWRGVAENLDMGGVYYYGVISDDDQDSYDSCERVDLSGTITHHLPFDENDRFLFVDDDPSRRAKHLEMLRLQGANCSAFVHPGATVDNYVDLGEGAIVLRGAVVSGGAIIGKGAIIEEDAYIGYGSKVGSWVVVKEGERLENNCIRE